MDLTNYKKEKRRSSIDLSTMVYGKVPPQAKDLEEAILGAIMLEKTAFDTAIEILTPESFYVDAHQRIFRAMQSLQQKNQPIDILTVVEELRNKEELDSVGGPYYVTKLTQAVVSGANIGRHSQIIHQKFLQRELIRIGGEIVADAYEDSGDVFEMLDQAEENILAIGKSHIIGQAKGIDHVLVDAVQLIEKLRQNDSPITGVPSGFEQLDRATRGWQPCDLIILAARTSIGKTSLALKLIRNAAKNQLKPVPVACWSLEMSAVQLILRMLSAESGIMLHHIQTGRLDNQQMGELYRRGIQSLASIPVFIDDEPGLTLFKLRAKARRLKKKFNIGLMIIDYLQLMSGDENKGNREQEISRISRGLKLLAKELGIPIIALSQLSREIEKRTGSKRIPQLSDLRESGAIEQDADVVVLLWGPEDEEIEQDASLRNRRYARIAKARNGMLVTIDFNLNKDTQEWEEVKEEGNWVPMEQTARDAPRMPYADNDKEPPF